MYTTTARARRAPAYEHQQSARPRRIVHDTGCTAVHLRVTSAVPAVNGDLACVHFVGDARQSERKEYAFAISICEPLNEYLSPLTLLEAMAVSFGNSLL
jgi:hypothetical protein